jgi:hypothetical protein
MTIEWFLNLQRKNMESMLSQSFKKIEQFLAPKSQGKKKILPLLHLIWTFGPFW